MNEYLNEPGVALANKYAELKEKLAEIEGEIEKVREAILDYAKREGVEAIKGSDRKTRVKFDKKLKFPGGENEEEHHQLDNAIIEEGKWMEVLQLDTSSLACVIENGLWSKYLSDKVMRYGRIERLVLSICQSWRMRESSQICGQRQCSIVQSAFGVTFAYFVHLEVKNRVEINPRPYPII